MLSVEILPGSKLKKMNRMPDIFPTKKRKQPKRNTVKRFLLHYITSNQLTITRFLSSVQQENAFCGLACSDLHNEEKLSSYDTFSACTHVSSNVCFCFIFPFKTSGVISIFPTHKKSKILFGGREIRRTLRQPNVSLDDTYDYNNRV